MRFLKALLKMLLPKVCYQYVQLRHVATKKTILRYKGKRGYIFLKLLKNIIIIPFELIFFLIKLLLQIILIWTLSPNAYNTLHCFVVSLRYISNEFYADIGQRGYSLKAAIKRFKILYLMMINGREKYKSYGSKNEDKIFFVIRPYYYSKPNEAISAIPHLLTNYYCVLQYFAYAISNGWIPIVDWENYELPHSESEPVHGTNNAWEYYWKQISEYTLEEVYSSKNVVLGTMNIPSGYLPHLRTPKKGLQKYAEEIIKKGSIYAKNMEFNDITKKYIEDARKKIFPSGKKIMGVAIRGTSYSSVKAGHHAAQPEIDEMVTLVKLRFEQWGADYIFFTNEEEETVDMMKEIFGDKLLYLPRKRYKNYHIYSDNSPNPTDEDLNPLYIHGQRYQTNLDYITEMALLSQCDFLLSALSNGIKAVLLWGGKNFEKLEIIDKGTYPEAWEQKK